MADLIEQGLLLPTVGTPKDTHRGNKALVYFNRNTRHLHFVFAGVDYEITTNAYLESVMQVLQTTAFGETLTARLRPRAGWRGDYPFTSTPNPILYVSTATGSGTISSNENRFKLSTGTDVNGAMRLQTRRVLRYMPGIGGLVRFTAVFETPKASTRQIVGIGDSNDGFFFGYDGTTFGVLRRNNGSDTWVTSANWNGEAPSFTPDYTKGNIFQIRYQWLGYGFIRFYIYDPNEEDMHLLHAIKYPNTSASVSVRNPTLPLMAEVANTGNNTNMVLYTPSALGATEGDTDGDYDPFLVVNSVATSPTFNNTNENHVITIRNKATAYAGSVTNRITVCIKELSVARDGSAALTTFKVYRSARATVTYGAALTFVDYSADYSPVETSTTTTTVTGGTAERTVMMKSGDSPFQFKIDTQEMDLRPGDYITISCTDSTAASTQVAVSVTWGEEF
jgi:hypothetical protein